MAEPGLQKIQTGQVDLLNGTFETAEPNVKTTSQPLPSGRTTRKKQKLIVSDKDGNNICKINMKNIQSNINVYVGDTQVMTENSDSGSSNGSEPSSVESREEQIAYSSGDSIGSQFPSGSTNLEKNCEKKKELEQNRKKEKELEQNGKKEKKLERNRKRKKNCRLRIFVLTMIISGCVSGVAAWIIHNNYFLGLNETPPPKKDNLLDFPDKCDSNISSVTVGEPICITLTEEFTSSPSRIHVRQMSSQYLGSLQSFSVNVSIDPFVQHNEDVIIGYNSSRTNKEFRFALKKATCDNVGKYNITFEYSDGKVKSLKWKFRLEDGGRYFGPFFKKFLTSLSWTILRSPVITWF
ncbi:uncharacterized protein [Mytilus edulis]|uniref:uncharacterized protein isoform X3 n=1 Tax=Mytilus edulis TaxID=6550 RepID=UPI0039EE9B3D